MHAPSFASALLYVPCFVSASRRSCVLLVRRGLPNRIYVYGQGTLVHTRVERCAYLRQAIVFMRARVNLP